MKTSFQFHGRVTQGEANDKTGVHGLCVEVWHQGSCENYLLGSDLTNGDGSYAVCTGSLLKKKKLKKDTCWKIYLVIKDCECRVIHDSRDQCQSFERPGQGRLDVHLAPDVLWWHRHCGSWICPQDPLVPKKVFQEIEEALEVISPRGLTHRVQLPTERDWSSKRVSECLKQITPLVYCFDNVLRDAWETLQGDLNAARRYRDTLETLCGARGCSCQGERPYEAFVNEAFSQPRECRPQKCCGQKKAGKSGENRKEACCPADSEALCPCQDSLIEFDKAAVLLMAALHLSCRHEATAKQYVLTLLEQFCRFQFLGALHRAAVNVLCERERSRDHFKNLTEVLIKRCEKGFCCCETCLDEKLAACLRDMICVWSSIECYHVKCIEPKRACPGESVVIGGCGFGEKPGQIEFRPQANTDALRSEPTAWCDQRIELVVPNRAGCGLTPMLPPNTVQVCGRFLEYRPTGCLEEEFEGTSPEILKFIVKDHVNNACLQPGEPLKIRWKVCAADSVKVEILNKATGQVIASQDPADARGCWDFTDTRFTSTTEVSVRITAHGKCKPPTVSDELCFVFQRTPELSVDGMEVTQAIQYYHADEHLTDPADRGPDNSLRLVTGKTAWVRVYLRSGQHPGFDGGMLRNVSGSLIVERRTGGVWNQVAAIAPQNGPVDARDTFVNYNAERGNINNSLNFVVPANLMTGLLRFRAEVASPFAHCPGNSASRRTTVDVNLTQTLNAAFITIGYNGPNNTNTGTLNLPAPTLAQCQAETSWAMTTFPVSGAPNVRIAGSFVTPTPLNDPRSCPGCCSPNWGPLLNTIAAMITADQAAFPAGNWVYYGIINGGIPVTVPGCNGVATGGLAGRPGTYAHEIGHLFGLPHARCGNVGGGNPNYPIYEPYDLPIDPAGTTNWTMASIGEYGLDINNGNIANPQNAEDFMSYCGPRWISIFTHNFLVNQPSLTPQVIATGSGEATNRMISDPDPGFSRNTQNLEPLIDLLGTVEQGEVKVESVARLETRYLANTGRPTEFTAELLNGDRVIASNPVHAFESEGGCCGGGKAGCHCQEGGNKHLPIYFRAMIDDVAPGDCLRIVDQKGEVHWHRDCPDTKPTLTSVTSKVDKESRKVVVSWRFQCDKKAKPQFWVRWSNDGGKTWRALTVGLTEKSIEIDPDNLPSGEILFQVMAHDGFSTVTGTAKPVNLETQAPQVTILYPVESSEVYAERQLHLFATASVLEGSEIADENFNWFLDDSPKPIANGRDVWVDNPGRGKHQLRLEVEHDGKTGKALSEFEI